MVVVVVPACSMFSWSIRPVPTRGCVFGRGMVQEGYALAYFAESPVYPLVHNFNTRMDGCQLSVAMRNIRAVIAALVVGAVLVAAASVVCSVCSPSEAAAAANQ